MFYSIAAFLRSVIRILFHPITVLRDSIAHIRYSLELDTTLRDLEAKLHDSDDPDHIIRHVLEVACKFYGADWAGFLDVDMELGLWTPFMWYNSASEDKTTVLLSEYESMEQFDQWGNAMETGDAIIIPGYGGHEGEISAGIQNV